MCLTSFKFLQVQIPQVSQSVIVSGAAGRPLADAGGRGETSGEGQGHTARLLQEHRGVRQCADHGQQTGKVEHEEDGRIY